MAMKPCILCGKPLPARQNRTRTILIGTKHKYGVTDFSHRVHKDCCGQLRLKQRMRKSAGLQPIMILDGKLYSDNTPPEVIKPIENMLSKYDYKIVKGDHPLWHAQTV